MQPISLSVRRLGHVPAKKNSKMIVRDRKGRPTLITKPEYQKWIANCIRAFESQLRWATQTNESGIATAPYPLSLIASLLPENDSWKWIPEIHVKAIKVPKGTEGANILIEQI